MRGEANIDLTKRLLNDLRTTLGIIFSEDPFGPNAFNFGTEETWVALIAKLDRYVEWGQQEIRRIRGSSWSPVSNDEWHYHRSIKKDMLRGVEEIKSSKRSFASHKGRWTRLQLLTTIPGKGQSGGEGARLGRSLHQAGEALTLASNEHEENAANLLRSKELLAEACGDSKAN